MEKERYQYRAAKDGELDAEVHVVHELKPRDERQSNREDADIEDEPKDRE